MLLAFIKVYVVNAIFLLVIASVLQRLQHRLT